MSSEQAIRGMLQSRLITGLGWADQTAFEGKAFTPTPGVAYQELATEFTEAIPLGLSESDLLGGTFRVRLLYPLTKWDGSGTAQVGIGAPTARAEAVKALFPRTYAWTVGSQTVKISRAPRIRRAPPQGDRDVTIVDIRFGDR